MEPKAELLSLQQIRCFCAAVELGSFTAAAEVLRVSQPAVAEQIRKLEHALGADLFVRAGRGVVPTEAGRAFAVHAARSLRAVEDAADSVGELTALRSGTVALGVFGEPSAWRMDELVAAFMRRHPGVSVRLVGRNSSAVVERIRRGELEAGVVLLPIDADKVDVRPIVRDEVLYVSADPERTRQPATIERLAATPLVFYDAESADNDPIRRQLAERAQALGVRLQPKVEVELEGPGAAARRRGHRRHVPPQRVHARALLPRGPDHGLVPPGALRHLRHRHPRRGRGSRPAYASCSRDVEAHMRAVAEQFDRSR